MTETMEKEEVQITLEGAIEWAKGEPPSRPVRYLVAHDCIQAEYARFLFGDDLHAVAANSVELKSGRVVMYPITTKHTAAFSSTYGDFVETGQRLLAGLMTLPPEMREDERVIGSILIALNTKAVEQG